MVVGLRIPLPKAVFTGGPQRADGEAGVEMEALQNPTERNRMTDLNRRQILARATVACAAGALAIGAPLGVTDNDCGVYIGGAGSTL